MSDFVLDCFHGDRIVLLSIFFFILLSIFIANVKPDLSKYILYIIVPISIFSIFFSVDLKLFAIESFLLGVVLFCVINFFSVFLTTKSVVEYYRVQYKLHFLKLGCRVVINSAIVHLFTAIIEESIWRVFIIDFLKPYFDILACAFISAVMFWAAHPSNLVLSARSVEFFIFSLLLGGIYIVTNNFFIVVTIHFLRNFLIFIFHINDQFDKDER